MMVNATPAWKLVWQDDFKGPEGSPPDASRWHHDVGGDGWGNHELEYYTDRPDNAHVRDGHLEIVARRESFVGQPFTSARLQTAQTFSQAYGRFEARIQIPPGEGMWPAFWLLGNDIDKKGWPGCGEIDVMENVGQEPSTIHGSMHGPGYSGDKCLGAPFKLPDGQKFSDDYHDFAVEWKPGSVQYFVDGQSYQTLTPQNLPPGQKWVFDHPFFIILNLAVGGDWPGPPDDKTPFPASMKVQYVRVYEPATGAAPRS
ncbi:MAG TPA: glycoside hydrolase family 16 protein [Candidatus Xenobia bacterium]|jgi:beta-glucanase (GH16 family)